MTPLIFNELAASLALVSRALAKAANTSRAIAAYNVGDGAGVVTATVALPPPSDSESLQLPVTVEEVRTRLQAELEKMCGEALATIEEARSVLLEAGFMPAGGA